MSQGRILFADNDATFRSIRARFLHPEYEVLEVDSPEEAERVLSEAWVHLAIIDIRLRDDDDERDVSGLLLAKDPRYRDIPKIILTAYPSFEYVREILRPAFNGMPVGVDFLSKLEGAELMQQTVLRVFEEQVRINHSLLIQWQEHYSFEVLTSEIVPACDRARLPALAAELEDLFRKLFYDMQQITISSPLGRHDALVVLTVLAYRDRVEQQFVVSCGLKARIFDEQARYEQWAPKEQGIGSTSMVQTKATSHFAATTYRLFGADLEETTSLRTAYPARSDAALSALLDALCSVTLNRWHKKGRSQQDGRALRAFYLERLGRAGSEPLGARLHQRLAAICRATLDAGLEVIECDDRRMIFHPPHQEAVILPSPVAALEGADAMAELAVLWGVTHGAVDVDTVLVDHQGQSWLVDFTQADEGPLVHDFVALERSIRLTLFGTSSLVQRFTSERRLFEAATYADPASTDLPPDARRALLAIAQIRAQAEAVGSQPPQAYLLALLFATLHEVLTFDPSVRYPRRSLIPYAHSLLLTGLLAEQLLGPVARPTDSAGADPQRLWVDEVNKAVWVRGKPVALTPQEYRIVAYLYRRAGELCSRQQISREALDASGETFLEESRLNSALSRLRQKIEPDPEHPRYIITVRGHGFKLIP